MSQAVILTYLQHVVHYAEAARASGHSAAYRELEAATAVSTLSWASHGNCSTADLVGYPDKDIQDMAVLVLLNLSQLPTRLQVSYHTL
jgi:hypothetical protein